MEGDRSLIVRGFYLFIFNETEFKVQIHFIRPSCPRVLHISHELPL